MRERLLVDECDSSALARLERLISQYDRLTNVQAAEPQDRGAESGEAGILVARPSCTARVSSSRMTGRNIFIIVH